MAYVDAVELAFGVEIDYAQLLKLYRGNGVTREGYAPSDIISVTPAVLMGKPERDHISTSYVERQNLTMRMQMRRFTRLTNGFSKTLKNLEAAITLHFFHYNFMRIHQTLRVTPAMEAGISDHIWTWDEVLNPH